MDERGLGTSAAGASAAPPLSPCAHRMKGSTQQGNARATLQPLTLAAEPP